MITIQDKKQCAGCTACAASCPRKAISMVQDEEGFLYPVVAFDVCIDCGICNEVCAFGKTPDAPVVQETYAVQHNDGSVLENSTSGGFFTAISDYVLDVGGTVYGVVFDADLTVRHRKATNKQERDKMRGSKYVQSDLNDTFLSVKKDLTDKKTVLFTGTPCQVAGLKEYLHGNCDGLICCDLICHGVASPLIFREHLKFLAQTMHKRISDYQFRPKKWGWHIHREIVWDDNGNPHHSTPYTDLWRGIYYSRIVTRPSCSQCPYSNLNRCGDITIGDCRGIDKVIPHYGSEQGVSLVMVNTPIGKEVFQRICWDFRYDKLNVRDVLQPPLLSASKANPSYDKFFADYRKNGYRGAISNYFGRLYAVKFYVKKMLKVLRNH